MGVTDFVQAWAVTGIKTTHSNRWFVKGGCLKTADMVSLTCVVVERMAEEGEREGIEMQATNLEESMGLLRRHWFIWLEEERVLVMYGRRMLAEGSHS